MSEVDRRPQVVGVDGSLSSKHALAWAIARADLLGPVKPVAAWQYPWWAYVPTAAGSVMPPSEKELAATTERVVDNTLEGLDRSPVTDAAVVRGSAGPVLVAEGSDAALVVVGTRGLGAITSGLLGSVGAHCARHATVPVAVIPEEALIDDQFGSVVVGHDGSKHADVALEWALRHTPPSTEVLVVNVWDPRTGVSANVPALTAERLSDESLAEARSAVERVRSNPEFADRRITAVTESGDPRDVLRRLSQTSDMLVIGSRGLGAVAYLLLGSVAAALVHHPVTATVLVR